MSKTRVETVTMVRYWTDDLFSFATTRDSAFEFKNGEFVMIGLEVDGKPLLRAYSLASSNQENRLEFFSIKVPDGPLTSRLQNMNVGDEILVGKKSSGTLLIDHLLPGKHLWLLATGTGLAPFLSIIKDPEAYARYEKIILVHGCRTAAELAYQGLIEGDLPRDARIGSLVEKQLLYYPLVTREAFRNMGRVTKLLEDGALSRLNGLPPVNKSDDRFMLCGSPQMILDMPRLLTDRGFAAGNHSEPGHFLIEKAFVE